MTPKEKIYEIQELRDPSLRMQRFLTERAMADAIDKMDVTKGDKGDKGEDGYTPVKGKDYYTEAEINAIITYIRAQVKDGKDSTVPGPRGLTGRDGKDATVNHESIIKDVLAKIPKPKDGSTPDIKDIVNQAVIELKKQPVDFKDIKGTEQLIAFLKTGGFRGGGGGGTTSPLTTKGDLYGFSTVNARIPVGSNNQILTADSTQPLGVKWAAPTVGGITTLNTDSTTSQTLTTGTTGTDFAIVDNGIGDHKFNLPTASGTNRGALSSADWTTFNNKGNGTVTAVSVATANGVSGSSSGGATPALTIALGAITPTTVNGLFIKKPVGADSIAIGENAFANGNSSGQFGIAIGSLALYNNTSGQYNVGIGYASLANGVITTSNNTAIGGYSLQTTSGSGNVGLGFYAGRYETGSNAFYVDNQDRTNTAGDKAKALLYGVFAATAASQTLKINAVVTTDGTITAPTFIGALTGTASGNLVSGGALGTPSSGTVTNLTGTASININGTVGATTPAAGTFTTGIFNAPVRLKGYTVATLPAGTTGDSAYCTDLLAPTFFTTAVGGGAVIGPVFYNGTTWICT